MSMSHGTGHPFMPQGYLSRAQLPRAVEVEVAVPARSTQKFRGRAIHVHLMVHQNIPYNPCDTCAYRGLSA
jgi:hypothetical protein